MDLIQATKANDQARIETLLNSGVHIDSVDATTGNTALHIATSMGYTSLCRFLVSHGADPGIRNKQGLTPLEIVAQKR